MAQATAESTTSRRSFLAAAATVPALAVPAIALPAARFGHPDLEAALIAASEELDEADNAEYEAERRMAAWLAEHPQPELDDVSGGDGKKIKAAYSAFHTAIGEWQQTRVAAWREFGVVDARRRVRAATVKRDTAALAVAEVVVTTMAGLQWKARMSIYDGSEAFISDSIALDLLTMADA